MHSTKKITTKEFIERSIIIHGSKYDYSQTEYANNRTKLKIICPDHGEFWQTPKQHLRGQGCPECGKLKLQGKRQFCRKTKVKGKNYTQDEYISLLKNIYGEKYDYTKVHYVDVLSPVTLTCPEHGEFTKKAGYLINSKYKSGCPCCTMERRQKNNSLGLEKFIEKANNIHHGFFDYSKVQYINNSTKVDIVCPKHGIFSCTPANHLKGRGCPICRSETYVYEERLYRFLRTFLKKDEIIRQYRADWLSNYKSLDFYIPKYKLGIEHQGSQHFYKTRFNGETEEKLQHRINNDKIKIKECYENDVKLLFFTYELVKTPSNCFYELIFNEEELKRKILNYQQL